MFKLWGYVPTGRTMTNSGYEYSWQGVVCDHCEEEYEATPANYIWPGDFEYCPGCGKKIDAEVIIERREA